MEINMKEDGRKTISYMDMEHTLGTMKNVYVGGWKNDTRHGKGRLTYADGTEFEGK